jgi:DNA helicase MCM8
MIHKISERKDLFALLVKSICPSIFGNELVKVGMIMSLFGGTDHRLKMKGDFAELIFGGNNGEKEKENLAADNDLMDEEKVVPTIRPDIHMLIVGDPGLGKSQMLKHLTNVSPRGVYVCGNSTTNAGLTATMVRDSVTNEQTLEAGALVLSDLGICCIDEFDKMTSD